MNKKSLILIIVIILDLIGIVYLILFKNKADNLINNNENEINNNSVTYEDGGLSFIINNSSIELDSNNNKELIININGLCTYQNGLEYEIRLKDKYYVNDKEISFNIMDSNNNSIKLQNNVIITDKIKYGEKISQEYKLNISLLKDNLEENDFKFLTDNKLKVVVEIVSKEISPNMIDILKEKAVMDNIASQYVTGNGINFKEASSDTNGKGLYIRSGTENDLYPILYYRGDVSDNYVEFAGSMWRIVRTTDTGGIKLIYDSDSAPFKSFYKEGSAYPLPIHSGYMYGKKYMWERGLASRYGSSVTYNNGVYTISDLKNPSYNSTHHYACDNSKCTKVRYYYCNVFNGTDTGMYFVLENGEDIETAIINMQKGENDTPLKIAIDNWFKDNILNYSDYLEDTVFCNDRSPNTVGDDRYIKNGWNPNGGEINDFIYYAPYGRIWFGANPNLSCRKIDAFTVNETDKGNGNLTYPVALLSVDELNLAGATHNQKSNYYLKDKSMWTMSPSGFFDDVGFNLGVARNGIIKELNPYANIDVYPSISLKKDVMLIGDGTINNPYKVKTN